MTSKIDFSKILCILTFFQIFYRLNVSITYYVNIYTLQIIYISHYNNIDETCKLYYVYLSKYEIFLMFDEERSKIINNTNSKDNKFF